MGEKREKQAPETGEASPKIAEAEGPAEGQLRINGFDLCQRAKFVVTDELLADLGRMNNLQRATWAAHVAGDIAEATFNSIREQQARARKLAPRRARRAAASKARKGK